VNRKAKRVRYGVFIGAKKGKPDIKYKNTKMLFASFPG
jgi:hypothetical protein